MGVVWQLNSPSDKNSIVKIHLQLSLTIRRTAFWMPSSISGHTLQARGKKEKDIL